MSIKAETCPACGGSHERQKPGDPQSSEKCSQMVSGDVPSTPHAVQPPVLLLAILAPIGSLELQPACNVEHRIFFAPAVSPPTLISLSCCLNA
jgi:hypothetical protein